MLKNFSDWLVWLVVRLAVCFVQSLSPESCRESSRVLAFLFAKVLRIRRRLLLENLSCAFPEMSSSERENLIQQIWEHLFMLVAEVALAPRLINEVNWWQHVKLVEPSILLPWLLSDRPVILLTGHFGNFEMGGFTLGLLGYPTYSVARTLDNPYLNDFIKEFRESTGQFLISKNDGYNEILDVLRHGEVIAFLADQSAGPKGEWVDFFGRPASAYKAMALLSLEYDAPIVICAATRGSGVLQFELRGLAFLDPRDKPANLSSVTQITQWFTTELEKAIRQHPNQYWWIHHRWKTYGKQFEKNLAGKWQRVK